VNESNDSHADIENKRDSLKLKILSATSYLLPFATSLPPFWGGIMTLPFLFYLIGLISNIGVVPSLLSTFDILAMLVSLLLLLYCVLYLWRNKKQGHLVTTGPYRFVRHPQYFSVTIFTLISSYQSIWILTHTFGMGWLSVEGTWVLWIAMLLAYVGIAWFEELHLHKVFGTEWDAYRNRVGFLLPFVRYKSRLVEAIICLIIPIVILYVSLLLAA
jgi:protein-S-isoprenylcysteine O-methyltransferase Ste14